MLFSLRGVPSMPSLHGVHERGGAKLARVDPYCNLRLAGVRKAVGLDIPVAVEDGHSITGGCSCVGGEINELDGRMFGRRQAGARLPLCLVGGVARFFGHFADSAQLHVRRHLAWRYGVDADVQGAELFAGH